MSILKLDHIDFEILARMIRTTRILDRAIAQKLSSFDVTKAQLDVMFVINFSEEKSVKACDIADELCVSKANISGILSRLKEKKFVLNTQDLSDSRSTFVKLTAKGSKILEKVLPEFFSVCNMALAELTKKEKITLLSQLYHIEDHIESSRKEIKERM